MADDSAGQRWLSWQWILSHYGVVDVTQSTFWCLAGIAGGGALSLVIADWHSGQTWALFWTTAGLIVMAIALGLWVRVMRRRKARLLKENGTAFIIRESGADMDADDVPAAFLAEVRRRFLDVFEVPGPVRLYRDWRWPVDERAREWDEKMGALTSAFRTLYLAARNPGTPAAVFIWAWWPVAVALGARLSSADRQLQMAVWQRPASGAAGIGLEPDPVRLLTQGPHRFAESTLTTGDSQVREFQWNTRFAATGPGAAPVAILLLRLTPGPWGPIELLDSPSGELYDITIQDTAGVLPAGPGDTVVHELRILPPAGQREFAWAEFPAITGQCLRWIEQKNAELRGHTLLLGTRMPQEIAFGMGVCAGRAAHRSQWPERLWPAHYDIRSRRIIVPNLDLGTAAMGKER